MTEKEKESNRQYYVKHREKVLEKKRPIRESMRAEDHAKHKRVKRSKKPEQSPMPCIVGTFSSKALYDVPMLAGAATPAVPGTDAVETLLTDRFSLHR